MNGVKDNTIDGQCSKCGKCCSNILLLREQEIKKIKKFIKQNNIKCNNKNSVMLNTSGGYIDRCPFLSNDNLCMIYEVRPEICKEFKCSSYCDVENTNMNYKNVRAINMLKTFYPDEYCPYNGIDLDLINQRLNNLSKQIYR